MWPKEGEKIRHGALCVFIFLLTISILSLAEGRIGYDISVTVNDSNNSTSWSRGHFISAYEFNSESHCKGDGNSSKYIFIKGLDDVSLKENTHTKEEGLKRIAFYLQEVQSTLSASRRLYPITPKDIM